MNIVLGVDPGQSTGVAIFSEGKLLTLKTIRPDELQAEIMKANRVIFEDSRLISHVYTTTKSRPAALKMARNIGEIDGLCKLICAWCDLFGIPAHGISPKGKGAKLCAGDFMRVTGWVGKSNAHERDAGMVAWPYRGAK